MLEIPKQEELNLIDKKEYRKRYREWVGRHNDEAQEFMKITKENKISWGTIVERNEQKYSTNTAILFEDTKLSYKEFNEAVNRYAHFFLSLGLKKGDVVEIMMSNRPEYIIILYALGKIGAIGSLINIDLRKLTLAHCLKLIPGKVIIVDENCFDNFNTVKPDLELSNYQSLYFLPDKSLIPKPDGFLDLSESVKKFTIKNPPTTSEIKTFDDIAYVFTSGTTGFPKATKISHYHFFGSYYLYGRSLAELTSEDTIYISLPLFHATSIGAGFAAAFGNGATIALGRKFSVSRFWDEIRKYRATAFVYIGEICRYLMNQPPKPNDMDNQVRVVVGPGLRPEIWNAFKERFNIEKIGEYYSSSESVGVFSNVLNFDCTVGCCLTRYAIVKYDYDIEQPIRNEEGFMERVDLGQAGLLLFENTGTSTFKGYTDKKATEAKLFHNVFKEGDDWFNTGDLLRDIGCNHAQFVDRLGDTYRWKGNNVSTIEVEKILNMFPQVLFSTVYGVKLPSTDGKAGMAAIVPNVNLEDFDLKKLMKIFKANLPPYANPIIIRFKSSIETTATFKLKKTKLKKEGFNIEKIDDPLYIILPHESEYISLTSEIYENIQKGQYKF
ncbi:MAG: long-chain-acyl-CoA synthetase [Promethearchaeota archaeon]|nr:MAG: long-chain-acyl-CoA synthetase [Candidatus Lokiarchaeota archaeon]